MMKVLVFCKYGFDLKKYAPFFAKMFAHNQHLRFFFKSNIYMFVDLDYDIDGPIC